MTEYSFTVRGTDEDSPPKVATRPQTLVVNSGVLWTPASLTYDAKALWMDASAEAGTLTHGASADYYRNWVDSLNGYRFTHPNVITNLGALLETINGRRAAYMHNNGANNPIFNAIDSASRDVFRSIRAGYIAAVWRRPIVDVTAQDRRIIYWSVESPGNGNNERFSLRCGNTTALPNGARSVVRQDYLSATSQLFDTSDHGTEIVIAITTVDWLTGDRALYVNGALVDSDPPVPDPAGLADSAASSKLFIGTTDNGNTDSEAAIGEILAQGLTTPLNTETRQRIEGYLAWAWRGDTSNGDPVAKLIADHPYKLYAPRE